MGWRKDYSPGFADAIVELWDNVKGSVPFDECTMDVLMTKDESRPMGWKAELIEFNGFGAHLNTGSDLFHWVNDHDILYGKTPGITLRFVDDWEAGDLWGEGHAEVQKAEAGLAKLAVAEEEQETEAVPDWLALEEKLRLSFSSAGESGTEDRLEPDVKLHLPLRGCWCSAY